MLSKLFKRTVNEDFIVIDSSFPQKIPFGFRNVEINEYFKRIKNCNSYTMYPMLPGPDAWFTHGYGVDRAQFEENKKGYLLHYPNNDKRARYLSPDKNYNVKLAYSFFLAETYVMLPFLEKNKIPFIFVLYPGGAFGLGNEKSDQMLQAIFRSKFFRGVIVTQDVTRQYLIKKKMCEESKMTYIYGGFAQFERYQLSDKKFFPEDKDTFDICFVAGKSSEKGIDKGYDIFIDVAKQLCREKDDIRFHVVGGFDENDIDISEIKSKIIFYGYKDPDFLLELYSKMDIALSPNRPFKLFNGNFDGFPLGTDASYCGVALFISDALGENTNYINRRDILIVKNDYDKIVKDIVFYYNHLDKLYDLARKGQTKTQRLFNTEHQIKERIEVFNKHTKLELIKPAEKGADK